MRRQQREEQPGDFGVTMPVFLGIWLVCAIIAGISWQNLVDNTPAVGKLSISFPAMIVLSVGFGLPGAGLVCMALDVFRRP
jgi:hypothetical protein